MVGSLALGFTGHLDFRLSQYLPARSPAAYQVYLSLYGGRVQSYWTKGVGVDLRQAPDPIPSGFTFAREWHFWTGARGLKRSAWRFDAHAVPALPGLSIFTLACPIWCAIIPFLIPPIVWLRKRIQKRRILRGFAMVRAEPEFRLPEA